MSKSYLKHDEQGRPLPADAMSYAIVFDPSTGLEWLADYLPDQMTLEQACGAGEQVSIAGGGWRLPTFHEAASIVDASRMYPARDPIFRGIDFGSMWTGSKGAAPNYAWNLCISGGTLTRVHAGTKSWVRLCRPRTVEQAS